MKVEVLKRKDIEKKGNFLYQSNRFETLKNATFSGVGEEYTTWFIPKS